MRKEMLDAGLPEPVYDADGMFTVTFRRPFKNRKIELTDMQSKLIQTVRKNPSLTMEEIGEIIGLGRTSVYKVVKNLKDMGILEHRGRKSDGEWAIKDSRVSFPESSPADLTDSPCPGRE